MPNRQRRLRLQDYLPYRLSVATNAVSRLIARAYESRFALKIPQWRLIAVLADEGPLTQQALCVRTIMDKVTVMRAAQGLLERGLIRRLPNAQDRRSHRLIMTAAGQRLYDQIVPMALEYQARLLHGMDRADILQLEQLLRRLEQSAIALSGG
ncbi:MAG TPA: MarR family winged helix-turn-helix transcriptional regulator [Steroidobacteraceae bacterium]|jgi:DNA-binding MarR family transcriptional regulator|nr:MarR family winged helix-turn-helix transcriptional regulator [Steroidobacteraceae bacterium]